MLFLAARAILHPVDNVLAIEPHGAGWEGVGAEEWDNDDCAIRSLFRKSGARSQGETANTQEFEKKESAAVMVVVVEEVNRNDQIEGHQIRHVFVMTGAVPNTGWLDGCVLLDGNGFIKTGPDLSQDDLATAGWPLTRPPYLLETSRPGVFAVGDVRGGNIKRVASAVGEGSIAIAFVHQVLQP